MLPADDVQLSSYVCSSTQTDRASADIARKSGSGVEDVLQQEARGEAAEVPDDRATASRRSG
jgi:hypothetical protein